jgi:hypothetical protein
MRLRPIGLADGLYSPFAGMLSVDLGGADSAAPDNLAGLGAVHSHILQLEHRNWAMPLALEARDGQMIQYRRAAGIFAMIDNVRADPILIKRYAGRRLYNTATLTYATLDDLANMVLEHRRFVVRDADTGSDITLEILDQILR